MNKKTVLIDTFIKKAKPAEKEYNLSDGDGLALRVKPNGSKIWLFNYTRPLTKKRANISFGIYPDVSLAQAREKRREARGLLADDIDPQMHRDEVQAQKLIEQSNTLNAVFSEWLEVKKGEVAEKQVTIIKRSFENHILPDLGAYPITSLKPQQVIIVIQKVESQGKADLTKRLCSRINEVMHFAANTGRLDSNPLIGITKAFRVARSQPHSAIKPDQLPWLLKKINHANIKTMTRILIEWQMHTMVRPSEAAGAKWEEIDFNKCQWTIPAERMKMKVAHIVPLTQQTLALLEMLKPLSGEREYLFPSYKYGQKHINSETVNMAFKRMGLQGQQTAHGLRSVASTTLNDQGHNEDDIEAALAHVIGSDVSRRYNRSDYLQRRRKLMEWWSNHVEQCATGNFSLSGHQHLRVV